MAAPVMRPSSGPVASTWKHNFFKPTGAVEPDLKSLLLQSAVAVCARHRSGCESSSGGEKSACQACMKCRSGFGFRSGKLNDILAIENTRRIISCKS
jgi:hypothetical protein